MKKLFLPLILLLLPLYIVYAVPAIPKAIEKELEDGSKITLYLHGDEFNHCYATAEGWIVNEDEEGIFHYIDKNGQLADRLSQTVYADPSSHLQLSEWKEHAISQPNKMKEAAQSIQRIGGFPLQGSPKTLVILVNFADKEFVTPDAQNAFWRLLNEPGYSDNEATGSAIDYFKACSQGQFIPEFDVVGPYTLEHDIAYYGGNSAWGQDSRPSQMALDACWAAHNNGIDFSQYDTDNDGFVDNVFIYYAGYNEAEGAASNTVWPHRYVVQSWEVDGETEIDGKLVYDYACTSELKGRSGTEMCGIGNFCHEFGHVLGLPDYYHTEDSYSTTLGYWSIMDGGAYSNEGRTPPLYSAYDRFFLGWLTPTEINSPEYLYLLPLTQKMETPADTLHQAYLLADGKHNMDGQDPDPNEFFIMEYRQQTGWDQYLPGEGVLFWHIDYNYRTWQQNEVNNYSSSIPSESDHMRVYIEPQSRYTSRYNPKAFTSGYFIPTLWDKTELGKPITDISLKNDTAFFTFMGGEEIQSPDIYDPTTIFSSGFLVCWEAVWDRPSESNGYSIVITDTLGNIVYEEEWVTDTCFVISGLDSDQTYEVLVNAISRSEAFEIKQGSQPIRVTTKEDSSQLEVRYMTEDGILMVYKKDADDPLFIYTTDGRLIQRIDLKENIINLDLNHYPIGQVYILKAGKTAAKWIR